MGLGRGAALLGCAGTAGMCWAVLAPLGVGLAPWGWWLGGSWVTSVALLSVVLSHPGCGSFQMFLFLCLFIKHNLEQLWAGGIPKIRKDPFPSFLSPLSFPLSPFPPHLHTQVLPPAQLSPGSVNSLFCLIS